MKKTTLRCLDDDVFCCGIVCGVCLDKMEDME